MEQQFVNAEHTGGVTTISDILLDRLLAWGVDTIFGMTGDGVNGFVEALRKKQKQIRFIHVRHEEIGALAAVAYAKLTGKIGVCFGTTGPGAVHLLNGMLDAQSDNVPLLAITGLTHHDLIGSETLQGADSNKMMEPFSAFNERIMGPSHVEGTVDRACRTALSKRKPVHISIPANFQSMPADSIPPSKENVLHHHAPVFQPPIRIPARETIEQAAQVLNGKNKIALLIGVGARGAGAEIEQVADILGAPVIKSLLGKDVIPDDSPFTTGGTGHTSTVPSQKAMSECDALLIVGSTMPFLKWYPAPQQAVCVQIDDMPERIGLRFPVTVGLAGDARATLQELLPLLKKKEDRSFLRSAQEGMRQWWKLMEEQGTKPDKPMKPQVPAHHLSSLLNDDAIILGDAGTVAYWISKNMKFRKGQLFSISGTSCTMASGLSYGIGAQVAYPNRQVVVLAGDGAVSMAMGDLLTLTQYKLPVKLLVFKNNTLALEKWEQMSFMGYPEFGNDLAPADFLKVAEACGMKGIRIEDPAECRSQLQAALSLPGPVLIECVVDPHEPAMETPLPAEHAANYEKALDKVTENKEAIARELHKSLQHQKELLPDSINEETEKLIGKLRDR
ncbi:thiamine pyrophosphate-binding protein [Longitalea arenae]|uniref:thiamine pyrophosphate-binding protein n=1 Tax=Longitalea arenae TaxID=2812558 RepID=UPI001967BA2A|nr:thiamine pyrophosphate-dependent enzyme [Longitalea arenae]